MSTQELIEDTLNVSGILSAHSYGDAAHSPSLINDLIEWRYSASLSDVGEPAPGQLGEAQPSVGALPKAKRGKATESPDSDFEATPDPSDDPGF